MSALGRNRPVRIVQSVVFVPHNLNFNCAVHRKSAARVFASAEFVWLDAAPVMQVPAVLRNANIKSLAHKRVHPITNRQRNATS